jgi:hypothetical protein
MQLLGTEWGRSIHPDFWTRLWEVDAYPLIKRGKNITADDVRFENEVAVIHKHGGKVIGLYLDPDLKYNATASEDAHASEVGITADDYIYNEKRSISELAKKVEEKVNTL